MPPSDLISVFGATVTFLGATSSGLSQRVKAKINKPKTAIIAKFVMGYLS